MSTDLTPFQYGDRPVRVVNVDGETCFVAADVCAILDLDDVRRAVERLHEDDRTQTPVVDSAGRTNPRAWVVNEPGLYDLLIRSDKPEARPFRRWVTSEVLPSIRKTGAYNAPAAVIPDMNTPEGQLQVAELLAAGARKQIEQAGVIAKLQPKADYVDAYVNGDSDATILRIVAKQLQVREQWLRQLLTDKKVISRRIVGSRWPNRAQRTVTLYEYYARAGAAALRGGA